MSADTHKNSALDAQLAASFPASDPPAATTPITATSSTSQVPASDDGHADVRVYRIIEPRQASQPFSGPGSDSGGRWTSPRTAGVYASLSPATAMLEYLAHLEGATPDELLLVTASVPLDAVLVQLELPSDWRERPYRTHVRQIGDEWSKALRIPSAVCPPECNMLINPEHGDFAKLQIEELTPIKLDSRLRI